MNSAACGKVIEIAFQQLFHFKASQFSGAVAGVIMHPETVEIFSKGGDKLFACIFFLGRVIQMKTADDREKRNDIAPVYPVLLLHNIDNALMRTAGNEKTGDAFDNDQILLMLKGISYVFAAVLCKQSVIGIRY